MKLETIVFQLIVAIFALIKGFASLKLLVMMGDDTYAYMSQFMVLTLFLGQLILFNYNASVVISVGNSENSNLVYHSTTLVLFITFSLLASTLLFFNDRVISIFWGDIESDYLELFLLYTLVIGFSIRNIAFFQAYKDFRVYSTYQISQFTCQVIAIFIGDRKSVV